MPTDAEAEKMFSGLSIEFSNDSLNGCHGKISAQNMVNNNGK